MGRADDLRRYAAIVVFGILLAVWALHPGCHRSEPPRDGRGDQPESRPDLRNPPQPPLFAQFDPPSRVEPPPFHQFDLSGQVVTAESLRKLLEPLRGGHLNLRFRPEQVTDETLAVLADLHILYAFKTGDTSDPYWSTRASGSANLTSDGQIIGLNLSGTRVSGPGLKHLAGLTKLTELDLSDTPATDDALKYLAELPNLRSLSLRTTRVTGPGLKHLNELTQLASLDLRGAPITDEGLEGARGLRCLTRLELERTKVTGPGLKHLAGMTHLTYLSLDLAQVTDAALGALVEIKMLHILPRVRAAESGDRPASPNEVRHLDLSNTAVTDVGLKHLVRLDNLSSVNLSHTKVTDAGLEQLPAGLRGLYLSGTAVTDKGMEKLARFGSLERVRIDGTAVTAGGMRHVLALKKPPVVGLSDGQVTDEVLEVLAGADRLHWLPEARRSRDQYASVAKPDEVGYLDLSSTRVTGAGLKHLIGLKNLTSLRLREGQMTGAGLKQLARRLTSLNLAPYEVTDKVLAALGEASLLHLLPGTKGPGGKPPTKPEEVIHLSLGGTRVTGAGLKHLAGLTNLTDLQIAEKAVTDDVLAGLAAARLLHALPTAWAAGGRRAAREEDVVLFSLRDTAVTDKGLKHLAGLKNLNSLGLEGTKVTDLGVAELQKVLPGCKIDQ